MSRQIKITKFEGNTHYSVSVTDSYGQEFHVGYYKDLTSFNQVFIEQYAENIWKTETKQEPCLMSKAIKNCIDIDIKNNITPSLD